MKFTKTDHETWQLLSERQVPNLTRFACQEFLTGFKALALPKDRIPTLEWLNAKINPTSGWTIVRTPVRYLTDEQWADHMSRREFPITNFLRTREELDFTPEPDIFHDIFGHLPMIMNPVLVELLNTFSKMYVSAQAEKLPIIAQLWWNTIEFGLIKERGQHKAFGAGLMSSFGEIAHAVSADMKIQPFTLEIGMAKPRAVASFHPGFLVNDSVKTLQKQLTQFAHSIAEEGT